MEGNNRPRMSLGERMAKIAAIQEKSGLENLVDVIMELAEHPETDLNDLGPKMRYAILQVLLIEAPPHHRPSNIVEHINILLNIRREKMGLPLSQPIEDRAKDEVKKGLDSVRSRVLPTLPGFKAGEGVQIKTSNPVADAKPAAHGQTPAVRHETWQGYRKDGKK